MFDSIRKYASYCLFIRWVVCRWFGDLSFDLALRTKIFSISTELLQCCLLGNLIVSVDLLLNVVCHSEMLYLNIF